jgi:hypothetical protein
MSVASGIAAASAMRPASAAVTSLLARFLWLPLVMLLPTAARPAAALVAAAGGLALVKPAAA